MENCASIILLGDGGAKRALLAHFCSGVGHRSILPTIQFLLCLKRKRSTMDGYDWTAYYMSKNPRTIIFRKFSMLSIKNLLYLQAEVTRLEKELAEVECLDAHSEGCGNFRYCWWELHRQLHPGDEQWNKVLEIRVKLEEYCKSRLLYSSLRIHILPTLD